MTSHWNKDCKALGPIVHWERDALVSRHLRNAAKTMCAGFATARAHWETHSRARHWETASAMTRAKLCWVTISSMARAGYRGHPSPASTRPPGTTLKTKNSTHPKKMALVLFSQSRWVPAGRTDLTNPGTRRYHQQEMLAGALVDALAGSKALLKHRRKIFKVDFERAILSNPGTRKHHITRC